MPLLIGTSGWQYRHWRGVLYPEGLPQRRWLEHYAQRYRCLEVNNAFYRLPERSVFEGWRDQTPDGFVVAVKVSRYLTHIKRLRDPEEPVSRLLDRAAGLGDRLGPFLLQLPPNLRADPERLDACLAAFGHEVRVAVEPRHESWWTNDVRDVLARHQAALCWADRKGEPIAPLWATAEWGYVRLHEGTADPWPSYGKEALAAWLDRIEQAWPGARAQSGGSGTPRAEVRGAAAEGRAGGAGPDVFVFFNNDQRGRAVRDADQLANLADHGAGTCRS